MRKNHLFFVLFIIPFYALSQETIILKDGSRIKCKITNTDSINIYFDIIKHRSTVHSNINRNAVVTILYYKPSDTIFTKKAIGYYGDNSFDTLSIKVSTLIFSGEVPMMLEYRPNKNIGNELSVGFDYMAFKFGASNDFGVGYGIKYGLRIYCHKNGWKNSWWYISPRVFYKQIWIKNRDYNSDYSPIGSGGADTYDEYLYKENRQVYGGQLLFGWAKTYGERTREFYFGFGLRGADSYTQITQWLRRSGQRGLLTPAEASTMPLTSSLASGISPSIQLGWNISFAVHRGKKR